MRLCPKCALTKLVCCPAETPRAIRRFWLCALFIFLVIGASAQTDTTAATGKRDSIHTLQNVTVSGTVPAKALQQLPGNVAVVDCRPYYNTGSTGLDMLRQTSGIKMRQSAGYGSNVEFFINGSTGRQVKYFIDGLPQDNLGETQGLNIIPLEQIERIEVYKGVLPADLGADALGAAINMVTRREKENYINASYAIGSFNTHKLNLAFKKYLVKKFYISAQAGAAYSDNDYKIDAEVFDQFGNPQAVTVPRFHDAFKNYSVRAEAGWSDTKWADMATITLVGAGLHRQLQSNIVMTQPYGKASYTEQLWSGIAKYTRRNLFKNFDVSAYSSYNKVKGLFMDTSKNVYNWYGLVTDRKFSGGELVSSGNELNIYTDVVNSKLTAVYRLSDHLRIIVSNTFQHYSRHGKDTVAQNYYGGTDFYGASSSLAKNIAGLGVEGRIMERLRFSSAVKYLFAALHGSTLDWNTQTLVARKLHDVSYNAGLAYRLEEAMLVKLSCEHAVRLPEPEEAFGDLMAIKPNPHISQEVSDNLNLNFLYNDKGLSIELAGFYRAVRNIIYLRPAITSAMYQNLLQSRVKGVEASAVYTSPAGFSIDGNITYQDLRNRSVIDGGGINNDRYKNARLPNIPYLFANGGVSYTRRVGARKSPLRFWYNLAYTHEYFLYWEIDGARELKNRIPTQLLHYTGLTWQLPGQKLSLAFEVNNLTARKAYDSFKAQLPGRSFSFKIRFYTSKKLNQ